MTEAFGRKNDPNSMSKPGPDTPPAPQPEKAEQGKPASPNARVLGIDVAKYQDKLDPVEMKQLYAKGYRYVHAKATDGLAGVDGYYKIHRRNAEAAGMIFGAYHFLRFGHSATEQAKNFHKTAQRVKGNLPPVIDVEWDRYTLNQKYGEGKRMDLWAETHARDCHKTMCDLFGVPVIVYTNAYFWPAKVAYPDYWKQFLCWIPSYADSLNPGNKHTLHDLSMEEICKAGEGLKVPPPWKQWSFWQDDDDLAIGDVKAIDTNVFRGSIEDLRKLAGAQ